MLGGYRDSMNATMWVRGFAADYAEGGEPAGEQWNFAKWSAGDLGAAFTAQLHRCLAAGALTVASKEFVAHGYARASVARIARDAGVSKKTIYLRYPSKDELLIAVVTNLTSRAHRGT